MTSGDLKHIGRFMTIGAAAGGGGALLRSLLRELDSIRNESGDTEKYLPLILPRPKSKSALTEKVASGGVMDSVFGGDEKGSTSAWTYLLGVPAALLAGGGAYKATSMLYDKYQEKRLRDRLRQVQQDYQDTLMAERQQLVKGASTEKRALFDGKGTPASRADMIALAIMATVPLSGYASHILTKRYLDKSFPQAKAPEPEVAPVRVQYGDDDDGDLRSKIAAAAEDPQAWHMCGRVAMEHTGNESILYDLSSRAASEIGKMEDEMIAGGFAKLASTTEELPRPNLSRAQVSIGLMRLIKSASLSDPVKLLISSEIQDISPTANVDAYMGTTTELALLKQASMGGTIGALTDLLSSQKVASVLSSTTSEDPATEDEMTIEDEDRSRAVQQSLDEFATDDDADADGSPDDALVSLLGSASQAVGSAGDGVDIEEAAVDSRDIVDDLFSTAPRTGQERRTALQAIRVGKQQNSSK